ncbi:MAG TPA: phosphotransacetylase family protein [Methanosarcinales archaeon]|nr:phosphotransacetylase family protein [Methanosarcinales archaeon]
MKSILIGSCEGYSGKSAICIGLGTILKKKGLDVGYMKPFGNQFREVNGVLVDGDAKMIRTALGLDDPPELVTPVMLTHDFYYRALTDGDGMGADVERKILDAYEKLSDGRDVMIIEGNEDLAGGVMYDMSDIEMAKKMHARILLVSRYQDVQEIDNILNDQKMIGDPELLIGVVLNGVIDQKGASDLVVPFLKDRGITVFGIIPKDPVLKSVSIGEIADALGSEILVRGDRRNVLVDHFFVGAMEANTALRYFRREKNFALITGGGRADIQLAALEAGVKCIILTGNTYPSSAIFGVAGERGVPIMVVSGDTMTTVEEMETIMGRSRILGKKKIVRIEELLEAHLDIAALETAIGL